MLVHSMRIFFFLVDLPAKDLILIFIPIKDFVCLCCLFTVLCTVAINKWRDLEKKAAVKKQQQEEKGGQLLENSSSN